MRIGFALGAALACATGAHASDLPAFKRMQPAAPVAATTDLTPPPSRLKGWEVRVGAFAHDLTSPERTAADLNVEIVSPELARLRIPHLNDLIIRAHVGGTINFNGKTSQGYVGVVASYDITQKIFIEGAFGGMVSNAKTGEHTYRGRNEMGCKVNFHESASIGYRFTPNWALLATVEHSSNAGLCSRNRGLTNYGGRISYTF